jgi:hypothetical protein
MNGPDYHDAALKLIEAALGHRLGRNRGGVSAGQRSVSISE